PVPESTRSTTLDAVDDPNVPTAMTPAPSPVGVPRTGPCSPVVQIAAPVDGSSFDNEPPYVVPPIVMPGPATVSVLPSHTAAASPSPASGSPTRNRQTGPAPRLCARSA